ncbi:hypothetical protein FQN49_006828 [Arthroderma sp. PD_2]|nr:hypothetical protein FQN49_006828 [Arthroderma sp. PD_2]
MMAPVSIRVLKYPEGQHNKAFLLTFSNGSEVVAKLPNPNAGPNVLTTASEVATMDYVRNIIGLPAPQVLSWNSDSSNSVGSEYLILEKAKGTALGEIWYKLPRLSKFNYIKQVVQMETKLASFSFPEHGCIYYAQDLPTRCEPIHQHGLPGDGMRQFSIGPVVDSKHWSDGCTDSALSRGPWSGLSDYATSIGINERIEVTKNANQRINYFRGSTTHEMRGEYLELVEKYLLVAPFLTQHGPADTDLLQSTLWHHDLHLNNIYVDPKSETITNIIDWQGVKAAPLILQAGIPRMVRHTSPVPLGLTLPERPDGYEALPEENRLQADELYESALCHKLYEVFSQKRNPLHYEAIRHNDTWKSPVIDPINAIIGAWSSREVYKLRASLMAVMDHWSELQYGNECPISFTEDERRMHEEELENRCFLEQMMQELQKAGILPADGIVDPGDYEAICERNRILKEEYMKLAEDDGQRVWMEKVWPYQDRPEDA